MGAETGFAHLWHLDSRGPRGQSALKNRPQMGHWVAVRPHRSTTDARSSLHPQGMRKSHLTETLKVVPPWRGALSWIVHAVHRPRRRNGSQSVRHVGEQAKSPQKPHLSAMGKSEVREQSAPQHGRRLLSPLAPLLRTLQSMCRLSTSKRFDSVMRKNLAMREQRGHSSSPSSAGRGHMRHSNEVGSSGRLGR